MAFTMLQLTVVSIYLFDLSFAGRDISIGKATRLFPTEGEKIVM